jgi:hypothetical protein
MLAIFEGSLQRRAVSVDRCGLAASTGRKRKYRPPITDFFENYITENKRPQSGYQALAIYNRVCDKRIKVLFRSDSSRTCQMIRQHGFTVAEADLPNEPSPNFGY